MILYHGSTQIIEKPMYEKGKIYNDYGRGFYCTEQKELAGEWACGQYKDGYINQYELKEAQLRLLDLLSGKYTVLHWLALLMEHRRVRISTPMMKLGVQWLKDNFLISLEPYDIVKGYRADDSYFSFARAFVNNEISLEQLSYAMRLGKLGEQIVLKSERAFEYIYFVSYQVVDSAAYFPKRKERDETARAEFRTLLEQETGDGVFIRDLIRGR